MPRQTYPKTCPSCGRPFSAIAIQRYCCDRCKDEAYRERRWWRDLARWLETIDAAPARRPRGGVRPVALVRSAERAPMQPLRRRGGNPDARATIEVVDDAPDTLTLGEFRRIRGYV